MTNEPTSKRLARIKSVVKNRTNDIVMVLEDIHDPHNAAAILRTCDACGIQNVHFIFDKTKSYNPAKVGKVSSSSANKWLTFHKHNSAADCLDKLKKQEYTIVSTILEPRAKSLYELSLSKQKVALVLGNEHTGISETLKARSDILTYIPMKGFVESLNVSVAAAVCLFEITRQHNQDKGRHDLSADEQQSLVDDFLQR